MEASGKLLTKQDVAKLLQVSLSTVSRWVKDGVIPHVKVGGDKVNKEGHATNTTIRFRQKDVDGFIQGNLVPSKQELLDKVGL